MREWFWRKLPLQKQTKSASANEVLLSLIPAFKHWTMTRSIGQRWICWVLWGKPKMWHFSHSMGRVLLKRLLYHRCIISNPKYSKQQNCKFPRCIECILQSLIQIFWSLIDKTVMNNEYSKFLYLFQIKTIMNRKCIKNKTGVLIYLRVTGNLSSGGTDFLIQVSWNIGLGPSKTSSLNI